MISPVDNVGRGLGDAVLVIATEVFGDCSVVVVGLTCCLGERSGSCGFCRISEDVNAGDSVDCLSGFGGTVSSTSVAARISGPSDSIPRPSFDCWLTLEPRSVVGIVLVSCSTVSCSTVSRSTVFTEATGWLSGFGRVPYACSLMAENT